MNDNQEKSPTPQLITNAGERYDGFSTRTVHYLGDTNNPLGRLVDTDDEDVLRQTTRYQSGSYFCGTPED
jgi:hypothetical protein